jgi:hypothetical protein
MYFYRIVVDPDSYKYPLSDYITYGLVTYTIRQIVLYDTFRCRTTQYLLMSVGLCK